MLSEEFHKKFLRKYFQLHFLETVHYTLENMIVYSQEMSLHGKLLTLFSGLF